MKEARQEGDKTGEARLREYGDAVAGESGDRRLDGRGRLDGGQC